MRWLAVLTALGLVVVTADASALPDDPRQMQHRVEAGLTPLYVTRLDGRQDALVDGPIDELNVGAIGLLVGYAFRPLHLVELRLRGQYLKPFPGRDALDEGLHELRLTGGVGMVLPLATPQLELAFGVDAGAGLFRLTAFEEDRPDVSASHAAAFTVAWTAGFRGWITDHTGVWGEAGFGLSDASSAGGDSGIASRWPLQVTLGWADRF
jgi:hypothetical protein